MARPELFTVARGYFEIRCELSELPARLGVAPRSLPNMLAREKPA